MRLITDRVDDGICLLSLGGQIDLHFAPVLRELFAGKAKAKCKALVLDLSEVTFIDSTGIAAVIEYLRNAAAFGGAFCVGGMSKEVKEILEVIKLSKAMPIFDTNEEALKGIRKTRPAEPTDGPPPVPADSSPTSKTNEQSRQP